MRRQLRWYGATPLHLLALLACFGLAGYAAARLIPSRPAGVSVWFLGAVIGHDLLLMPLYSVADRSVMAVIRHREPQLPAGPWINFIRVPAGLSGLLLLVWFPLILRLQSPYHASTTLPADPYVWHWLAITGVLFGLSAVAFALRLRSRPRTAAASERPAASAGSRPELAGGTAPELPGGAGSELPGGTGPDRDGGHETGSGAPAEDAPEQGHPPAAPGHAEPRQEAAEVTPADGGGERGSPGSPPGQQQHPVGHPDPASPSPSRDPQDPSRDPQRCEQADGRPEDQVPPTQPDGEPG